MGRTITTSGLPPRWGIQTEPGPTARRVLWFGPHRIAIDEIEKVSSGEDREYPVSGLLLGAMAFLIIASIFAFCVYENEWRSRYLLATVFLGFLGVAGIMELRNIGPQSFFQIKIATKSKGTLVFASADRAEFEAFLAGLASAGAAA